jgi:hypothetical protein
MISAYGLIVFVEEATRISTGHLFKTFKYVWNQTGKDTYMSGVEYAQEVIDIYINLCPDEDEVEASSFIT